MLQGYVCTVCSDFLDQQREILNLPVLGYLRGTALWIVAILYVRSWFLSQGLAVQTEHETCSSRTLHCQKSQSLFLMQSSPTLLMGQYYCRSSLYHIGFAEDSRTFVQADLKRKIYNLRSLHRGYSFKPLLWWESAICYFKSYWRLKYINFTPVWPVWFYWQSLKKLWHCILYVSHTQHHEKRLQLICSWKYAIKICIWKDTISKSKFKSIIV